MPEAGDPVIEAALLALKQEVLWWFWTTDAVSAHLPLNNARGSHGGVEPVFPSSSILSLLTTFNPMSAEPTPAFCSVLLIASSSSVRH